MLMTILSTSLVETYKLQSQILRRLIFVLHKWFFENLMVPNPGKMSLYVIK